jgi:hypothetical protein
MIKVIDEKANALIREIRLQVINVVNCLMQHYCCNISVALNGCLFQR